MRLNILTILFLASNSLLFGQSIAYNLSTPQPTSHYFHVQMELDNFKEKEVNVKLPVWAPGSYLVREFAKHVNQVFAKDENGKELTVKKTDKNTWKIIKGKAKKVLVNYEVYAFELSVRTSFLDAKHGYLNGTSIFMYVQNYKQLKGKLNIAIHPSFKRVTTALPLSPESLASDSNIGYEFMNYDHLVDCPIEIGNHTVFDFTSSGVKHTVAMFGPANYDIRTLQKDMAKIVEAATQVVGENPNKEYTFIIHNVIGGSGGLEHSNSTTLNVDRNTYQGDAYIGFLGLVAHEYFHLWNVKRIRAFELGPFNYDAENYTSLLWVMEGFTSYYDELLLRRAGYYSEEQYIGKIRSNINYAESAPGARVQPVAHSSFDAWIKSYRPDANSSNTQISYYPKGQLLAGIFDAMIVKKFNGKKCLDDFMKTLYVDFYKKMNRGFTEEEFQNALEKFLGEDLDVFFADYVWGTKIPDYNKYYEPLGMVVKSTSAAIPSFGAALANEGGKVKVISVRAKSSAEVAGLSVGDEIIGINGLRIDNSATIDSYMLSADEGEEFSFLIARELLIENLELKMLLYERPSYSLTVNPAVNVLRNYLTRQSVF